MSYLTIEQTQSIQKKLSDAYALEQLAKNYKYDDLSSFNSNLQVLAQQINAYLQLQGKALTSLLQFFSQGNMPIQYNFKPIKGIQIKNLLDAWIGLCRDNTFVKQRLYSNNHRNILFRRVLLEQKQTINDYFSTVSEKSMLKADSIYPIVVQILSDYFLYEFDLDSITFFEKVNSFNAFIEIVQKFINSQKRILYNIKQDFQLLRRYEFERLFQFWEQENSELTLMAKKRVNMVQSGVQTQVLNIQSKETQTDKSSKTTSDIINEALKIFNAITGSCNQEQQLQRIDRICAFLRKQKIDLLKKNRLNTNTDFTRQENFQSMQKAYHVHSQPSDFHQLSELNDSNVDSHHFNYKILTPHSEIAPRNISPYKVESPQTHRANIKQKELLEIIQSIYRMYTEIKDMDNIVLEYCFSDIGIIDIGEKNMLNELMRLGMIRERLPISQVQFQKIMQWVMIVDKELTHQVLAQFVSSKSKMTKQRKTSIDCWSSFTGRMGKSPSRGRYVGKYVSRY